MGWFGIWKSEAETMPAPVATDAASSTSSDNTLGGLGLPFSPPVIHWNAWSASLIVSGTMMTSWCVHTWRSPTSAVDSHSHDVKLMRRPFQPPPVRLP